MTDTGKSLLRLLPGVDTLLISAKNEPFLSETPKTVLVPAIRETIDELRRIIIGSRDILSESDFFPENLLKRVSEKVTLKTAYNLKPLVNATGVVVHTNLGRSLLSDRAVQRVGLIASGYSNLEYNLVEGKRGSRYSAVEDILCELTGAAAAFVVNNNAAAVLLCLDTIAKGRDVIVSRGELVEIGGSFRIPDVMAKSGARLKEVGTTNRTHLKDYKNAVDENTGLLMKVHKSNFAVIGFSKEVSLKELVELGRIHGIPVMEDLGSGTLIDFSKYGLKKEPTVAESVKAGVDLVTFSGDKLLGGPQAGIILGSKSMIEELKQNPLTRALRIDKMTLAALESTLKEYRDEEKAMNAVPTLKMLTMDREEIREKALDLKNHLEENRDERVSLTILDVVSKAGGGALPLLDLESVCVGLEISGLSANDIEKRFRESDPPVIGRIVNDRFIMDLRTISVSDFPVIRQALCAVIGGEA